MSFSNQPLEKMNDNFVNVYENKTLERETGQDHHNP